jgi:hypothetical protein
VLQFIPAHRTIFLTWLICDNSDLTGLGENRIHVSLLRRPRTERLQGHLAIDSALFVNDEDQILIQVGYLVYVLSLNLFLIPLDINSLVLRKILPA